MHAAAGHTNVHYVRAPALPPGDPRNRRSALLNHVLFRHIYPDARSAADIPPAHVLMVVACGHMAKPQLFNRVGPCMLDEAVSAAVVPPAFHDVAAADVFDSDNADMMHGRLPYAFGAGQILVPGALPRATPHAYMVCIPNGERWLDRGMCMQAHIRHAAVHRVSVNAAH